MIRSMLAACPWAEIVDFGIVPDRREALVRGVRRSRPTLRRPGHDRRRLGRRRGPCRVGARQTWRHAGRSQGRDAAGKAGEDRADRADAVRRLAGQSQRRAGDISPDRPARDPDDRRTFERSDRTGRRRSPVSPTRSGSAGPSSCRSGSIGRDELGRPVLDMLGRGSSASLMAMALADGIAMLPPDVEPDRERHAASLRAILLLLSNRQHGRIVIGQGPEKTASPDRERRCRLSPNLQIAWFALACDRSRGPACAETGHGRSAVFRWRPAATRMQFAEAPSTVASSCRCPRRTR